MSDVDPFGDTPGGGWGVQLLGNLKATIGQLGDRFEDATRRLGRDLVHQAGALLPVGATVVAGDSYPASGVLVLDLGGPAQGRVWDLRRLVIGGLTVATAAAGSGDVYVSAAGKSAQPSGLAEWVANAASLPLAGTWGAGEISLRFPERLYVVISSGTSGQEYLAAARITSRVDTPTTGASESVGA